MRLGQRSVIFVVFLALHLLAIGAAVFPVRASEPIDPLTRPTLDVGRIEFGVSASYQPVAAESVEMTGDGPVQSRVVSHRFGLEAALKYKASKALSLEIVGGWNENVTLVERRGAFISPTAVRSRYVSTTPVTYGLSLKPWPDHRLDPVLRLQVNSEGSSQLGLSISRIADPIVLSARLGVVPGETDAFDFALGTGFVANDRVSFGASISHRTTPGRVNPPITVLGLRAGYAIDRFGKEVGVTSSAHLAGGATWVSFGVYWQGDALSW